MNKLKFLCECVESHINKFYSNFHALKALYMIHQQSGETVTNYLDFLKVAQASKELSRGNLTKHEELEKAERDDRNTANPDKWWKASFYLCIYLNDMTLQDTIPCGPVLETISSPVQKTTPKNSLNH